MKKIIVSLFILFFISGCWNYNELNDYAVATGMAIDYTNNQYLVSFLISNSKKKDSSANNAQYQSVLFSGEGETIYEAWKNVGLISPKQIYIGHLNSIVISEEVAKQGLYDCLEFLLEDPLSKKNFDIVLAKGSTAKDVLKITTPMTDFSSQTISENIKSTNKLQGRVVEKSFNDIIYELINDGIDTSINGFVIVGDVKEGESLENLETTEPIAYIKIDNLGIFKDDKLVAWADKDQSRGINIINNDVIELYLITKCGDGKVGVKTQKLNTKTNVSKNKIEIDTTGIALINEVTCDIDLEDPENIEKLEKDFNKQIKDYIEKGFTFAQSYNSDIFGFGHSLYHNNVKEYKSIDWYSVYKKIKPEITVDITIKSSGALQQSIERISNE